MGFDNYQQYYKSFLDGHPDTVVTFDVLGKVQAINAKHPGFLYADEMQDADGWFWSRWDESNQARLQAGVVQAIQGVGSTCEVEMREHEGWCARYAAHMIPLARAGEAGSVVHVLFRDLSSTYESEQAYRQLEARYQGLVDNPLIGVYILRDDRLVYCNARFAKLFGYSQADMIEKPFLYMLNRDDAQSLAAELAACEADETHHMLLEARGVKKSGHVLYLQLYGHSIPYEGGRAIIGTGIDVSDRKKDQETIRRMSYHDSLTGLPNRYSFHEMLIQRLLYSKKYKQQLAVMVIDLDRFKTINDTMGHEAGDMLIVQTAQRLTMLFQEDNAIFRKGGDEFILLLADTSRQRATVLADMILRAFEKPFLIHGLEVYVTCSMGISLYPDDGESRELLMKNADKAIYSAKRMGKNKYHFFEPHMHDGALDHLEMEMDLRKALERGEFVLHYQPYISLETQRIIGAEALVRWNHPSKGLIYPGQFIPVAEDSGLIIQMEEWVLKEACKQNKAWQLAGIAPFVISVNLSMKHFFEEALVDYVQQVLVETGLDSCYLDLEITESVTAEVSKSIPVLQQLKAMGVQISVDDFGTGYSSLSYLKRFPLDKLKIDQSFIRHLEEDSNDASIVKAIIGMAHHLQLKVIAEGVEKPEHLSFLLENRCNEVQGYYFSRPVAAERLPERMEEIEGLLQQPFVQ